jgi:ATP adenylyltransferase
MKQIWAPWRMEYIQEVKSGDCIFCTLPSADDDNKNFILYRGKFCFIIMNIFPYNTGHVMISPYRHLSCITRLEENEFTEINRLTRKSVEILRTVKSPEGFNVGFNLGKAGGAGFDEHIHIHIVPRWNGDTNYMPVLAETKVHPEHLRTTYDTMLPHFQNISI